MVPATEARPSADSRSDTVSASVSGADDPEVGDPEDADAEGDESSVLHVPVKRKGTRRR